MKRHTFIRLFALLISLVGGISSMRAQADLSRPLARDTTVLVGQLPNGLTYYIKHNHLPEHKVELRLVIKAGSLQENDNQQGLAHFMEHMEFNGLKHYPKNELVNYLQNIGVKFGADLNANTGWDRTYYLLPIPTDNTDNLRQGFQILSDWAGGALIQDEDVESERHVILEELRMRNLNAQSRMMRQFLPDLLNHSKYAQRQPGGVDSIVQHASAQLIRDFYHDWYRPDLMAVIVVGDIDSVEAKRLITHYFGQLDNPVPLRPREFTRVRPYTTKKGLIIKDTEATSYGFSLVYPPHATQKDHTVGDFRNSLIRSIFIQCVNRRLRDMTQVPDPPFSQAGLDLSGSVGNLTLLDKAMELDIKPVDNIRRSINTVIGELLNVATYGFSKDEIDISKKVYLPFYERAYKERNNRQSASFTDGYAAAFMKDLPLFSLTDQYRQVETLLPGITENDINAYAMKVLKTPDSYFSMITGPGGGNMQLPDEEGLIHLIDSAFMQTPTENIKKTTAKSLLQRLPKAGRIIEEKTDTAFNTITYRLSNGVLVTVKTTDFQKDQILFSGLKYGGSNIYGAEDKVNLAFLGSVIGSMGYGQFTPAGLSDFLSGKQVSMSTAVSGITDEVNGSCSGKDMETMLQLAYLQLTQPRMDSLLWKSWYNKMVARIPLLNANPQNLFSDSLSEYLYQGSPMSPIVIPTKADLDNIQPERILQIYHEQFDHADGFHFFFVGNLDTARLKPLIETYLASLPVLGTNPGFKDNGLRMIQGDHVFRFHKGKDKKSAVLDMYYGDIDYTPDLALKARMLGEAMTIKVLDTIRESKQLIYSGSVSASVAELPYGHFTVTAQMPCGPEHVDEIFTELEKEVNACKTSGVSESDLKKVKKAMIEGFKDGMKQNGTWLAEIKQIQFWHHDKNNFIDFEKRVNAVTSEDLRKVANMLFTKNHLKAATFPEN